MSADEPTLTVGAKRQSLSTLTNAVENWTIEDVSSGKFTQSSDGGGNVTRPTTWSAPALQWQVGGDAGKSYVDFEVGSLRPFKAGNKAYFHRVVEHADGTRMEQNWRCRVEGPVQLKLTSTNKEYEAYQVICEAESVDGPVVHTWYWEDKGETPLKYTLTLASTGELREETERVESQA